VGFGQPDCFIELLETQSLMKLTAYTLIQSLTL